jgi:hypothetical protein
MRRGDRDPLSPPECLRTSGRNSKRHDGSLSSIDESRGTTYSPLASEAQGVSATEGYQEPPTRAAGMDIVSSPPEHFQNQHGRPMPPSMMDCRLRMGLVVACRLKSFRILISHIPCSLHRRIICFGLRPEGLVPWGHCFVRARLIPLGSRGRAGPGLKNQRTEGSSSLNLFFFGL